VDDEERRRPARLEVVYEAAVGTTVADGLDLRGVGVVCGQLIELGGGRCVVDGASGEPLEVIVVGLAPEDGSRQVEVWCQYIANYEYEERKHKQQARTYQQRLEWFWNRHVFSLLPIQQYDAIRRDPAHLTRALSR
jgi:hypothetical protein